MQPWHAHRNSVPQRLSPSRAHRTSRVSTAKALASQAMVPTPQRPFERDDNRTAPLPIFEQLALTPRIFCPSTQHDSRRCPSSPLAVSRPPGFVSGERCPISKIRYCCTDRDIGVESDDPSSSSSWPIHTKAHEMTEQPFARKYLELHHNSPVVSSETKKQKSGVVVNPATH